MSDILKKFKSVFVLEEPESSQTSTGNTPPTAQAPATPMPPPSPVATTAGSVTDKFSEILLSALEKNNQAGFDYFEFRQSLRNLAKMPMDEQTRFQSAYAMAQTMGATPATLVESANFYLQVLASEQSKFNEAHQQQRAKLIGNREDEVKNLESMMQQKTEQIKQLTQQIEEHRQKAEQIRKELSDSTIKIENTKADFEATFASVIGQMQGDVDKMKSYLK
ncbi:MAG: hypothetical protein ABIQ93_10860 [Saprospiraceae bacterium]